MDLDLNVPGILKIAMTMPFVSTFTHSRVSIYFLRHLGSLDATTDNAHTGIVL